MASPRSTELRALAQRIVDALPAEVVAEAAVTGSVSRGVADDVSDVEVLLVTTRALSLPECYELAAGAGLEELDSWGPQGGPTRRVFGYCGRVPIELIWWSLELAEASVDALLRGEVTGSADAIVHALPLRTNGVLAEWQERLTPMPANVARAVIEDAALGWGGFAPEGFLTIVRPTETLARLEYMVGDVARMLRLLHAINGQWPPTTKRPAARADALAVKPDRFAERVDEALTDGDPARALRRLAELQVETVALAPDGPNVRRAREWLPRVVAVLQAQG
jgi:predicted nucleotidyltransferase